MFFLKDVESGQEQVSPVLPVWISGVWECSSFRVTDISGTQYEAVERAEETGRKITGLAFRKRFTRSEKAQMEIAALDDPSADMSVRGKAAELRADLKDNDAASYIDLDDERTRESVQNLESVGLLAQGRAIEILDGPVLDVERYNDGGRS